MDAAIGRCEGWCGLIDHHLVNGLCENCRNDGRIRDHEEHVELGVECALPEGYRVGDCHPSELKRA